MVLSDIEIANSVQMKPITDIAAELGLTETIFRSTENTRQKLIATNWNN